ncbi:hypothetical protein FB451DRAFT_1401672 [Mycena latifolia]|nr:hypothetical protein FB451DRAFT_1401672 [Mycena latifolia]
MKCIKDSVFATCKRCVRKGLRCEYLDVSEQSSQSGSTVGRPDDASPDPSRSAAADPRIPNARMQAPRTAGGAPGDRPSPQSISDPNDSSLSHALENVMLRGYRPPVLSTAHQPDYLFRAQDPAGVHHPGYIHDGVDVWPALAAQYSPSTAIPPQMHPAPDVQASHVDPGPMLPYAGFNNMDADSSMDSRQAAEPSAQDIINFLQALYLCTWPVLLRWNIMSRRGDIL